MKIGYLGPEGTFSEEASKLYTRSIAPKADLLPYTTIHDLLYAANRGQVKEAIVPIENSIEGTIGVVSDILAKEVNLAIKREIILPIYHYLISQKKTKLSVVTDVISHPQAIDQCRGFLRKNLPRAVLHLAHSTSEAVRQVAAGLGNGVFAAIGTVQSARLYGLKILVARINAKENKTRFVVLAKGDHAPTGGDKTSLVFSCRKDRPGSLHDILSVFAVRNINLTKIESRPSKKALGDYYFFADLEGHRREKNVAQALKELKGKTSLLKILGSYPMAKKGG